MGKNKPANLGRSSSKKHKTEKAFVVNTMKKAKTKPVATNLKKMSFQSKTKTEKADAKFKDLRNELADAAKTSTQKPKPTDKGCKKVKVAVEPVDMDVAAESFAKL